MQRVFSDADRAIRYAADIEAQGIAAAIETVNEGPRCFFVVRMTPRPADPAPASVQGL